MNPHPFKLCGVITFLFMSLLLNGCLDIEYHMQIKPDGTEAITCKIGMPAIFAGASGDIAKSLEENGYKVIVETEGDKHYVVGTRTSPKGQWFIPYPEKLVKEKVVFEPSYLNLLVVKKYSMKAQFTLDKDEVNRSFSDSSQNPYTQNIRIPFRYVVSVPGKISKYNADEVNGNKLVWKYTIRPDEKVDMEFTSYDINYLAVVLISLGVVFIGGLCLLRSSKHKKDGKREGVTRYDASRETHGVTKEDGDSKERMKPTFGSRGEYEKWKADRLRDTHGKNDK